MAENVVYVKASQKHLIEDNCERVSRLFDVRVVLDLDENGTGDDKTTACTVLANNAQDGVEEAKIYINALVGQEVDHAETVVETSSANCVKMVLKHRDNIEKTYQVVLSTSSPGSRVHIQGRLASIHLVRTYIEHLSSEMIPVSQSGGTCVGGVILPRSNTEWSKQAFCDIENEKTLDVDCGQGFNRESLSNLLINSRGQSLSPCLTPELEDSIDEEELLEVYNNRGISSSIAQLKISSHTDDSSDSSSDGEDEIFLTSPDYQEKVEFALKLGYSESHLLRALRKVGVEAGQNELLSELIKLGSVKPKGAAAQAGADDDSQTASAEESDDISIIAYQRQQEDSENDSNLRPIVIDGSNVAMSHGNKEVFSCCGIQLAVDWFKLRGHTSITVFVPQWRKETSRSDARIKDQEILTQLEKENVLVFTPSRRIGGKRVVCYDDRYVLKLAVETDGIVVSNDNYRDLINEKAEFKKVVEERLLMYSFVNDRFMPPDDPMGRNGPTLENFLQREPTVPDPLPPHCPYGSKKCTYGNKCKFYHPERKNMRQKSVTERLAEQAKQRMQEMRERSKLNEGIKNKMKKNSLQRTQSFNPNDLGKRELSPNSLSSGDHACQWGSVTSLDSQDDERFKQYNQKLSENLKKMEREEAKQEDESKRKSDDYENQTGLNVWTGSSTEKTSRCSPVINLNVPGQIYDGQEQFLSGHLLLAKKLSDEADSDEKKQKSESENMTFPACDVFNQSPRMRQSPEPVRPNPRPITNNKQKLSRQLSLQGSEDPRIKHGNLHGQLSLDPRKLGGKPFDPRLVARHPDSVDTLLKDFMHGQSQERPISLSTADQGLHGNQGGFSHQLTGDNFAGHAGLSRMQSAPGQYMAHQQSPQRRFPQMARQNSSSDPNLHKHEDMLESPSGSGSGMTPRGTLTMKDKSGAVTFQIGGGSRPMRSMPYSHSPTIIPETYCHQSQSREREFLPHQSGGYVDMSQPIGLPYIQHAPKQQPQQVYGPRVNANFGSLGTSQGQMYSQQGPMWAENAVGTSVNPDRSMTMSACAGGVNIPLPQQGPLPDDMPILASDPRYQLYYHLCGIFPEPQVRAVMNQHPESNNPKDICAYIIGAK